LIPSIVNEIGTGILGLPESQHIKLYMEDFDGFYGKQKPLVCYWPITEFQIVKGLVWLEFVRKEGIRMEANFFNERSVQVEYRELHQIGKELILELIEIYFE